MNAPLRVLQVTKSTAGVAEYVRGLAHGLDPQQFALTVVCLSENGPQFAAELSRLPGIQAFSLEMERYKIDPFSDARLALQLARIVRQGSYDLLHAHASKPGILARLAAAGSGVPVIYSPHCFAFHAGAGRLQALLVAQVENLAARMLTARIMTVSDGEQTLARRRRVGRPEQFVTVHSGIRLEAYNHPVDRRAGRAALGVPDGAPLVGTVGRLSRQKAPLDFVRMAGILHRRMPEVHFAWIGGGPLDAQARALAAELGLEHTLHFAGQRADIPDLLGTLDCFVLTSLWEGLPIVLLEARAARLPVVASDILGNDEIVRPGVDGWLAPPGDAAAFAGAVEQILCTPGQAAAFGACGREHIEQEFTYSAMVEGVARLYRQAARRPSAAPAVQPV
ncbi:MAG: glycosyltransferase family 4 protein [Chloroflexota bacterium]